MKLKFLTVWLAGLILLAFSCSHQEKTAEQLITVSILPQKYLVDGITGGKIEVNVLVPPGSSPESYEPSPAQVAGLSGSKVYFRIGKLVSEQTWIRRILDQNPGLNVVDLSEGIDLIEGVDHHHGEEDNHGHDEGETENVDPHIWMSAGNMIKMSGLVLSSLIKLYPEDSIFFIENHKRLLGQIMEIDTLFRADSQKLESLNFFIYHPALAYLARDYKMVQHVIERGGKEPGPAYLAGLIDEAKELGISYIFVQQQFNQENARTLAREIGAKVIQIDPLAEDWYSQMKIIHQALIQN